MKDGDEQGILKRVRKFPGTALSPQLVYPPHPVTIHSVIFHKTKLPVSSPFKRSR